MLYFAKVREVLFMAIEVDFIRSFLAKWETRQLKGYIPCHKRNFYGGVYTVERYGGVVGASGVTIGTGVDLGQNSVAEMRARKIPEELIKKFVPYFGKSKMDAVRALETAPLSISDAECEQLDKAVHSFFILYSEKCYNKESKLQFSEIPKEAQAVIVSLRYQMGSPNRSKGYPHTWKLLLSGDWKGAAYELENGFTRYENRRADEGKLLEKIQGGKNA